MHRDFDVLGIVGPASYKGATAPVLAGESMQFGTEGSAHTLILATTSPDSIYVAMKGFEGFAYNRSCKYNVNTNKGGTINRLG